MKATVLEMKKEAIKRLGMLDIMPDGTSLNFVPMAFATGIVGTKME